MDSGIFADFDAAFPMSGTSSKKTSLPTSATKTLIVALWSLNTKSTQHLSLDARWQDLQACVNKAYVLAQAESLKHHDITDKPFALFVAPEYLMAQPVTNPYGDQLPPLAPDVTFPMGHPGDRRHIDEAAKDTQLNRYIGLSNNCKGMILVPGTIAWRKPLERSVPKQTSSKTGLAKPVSRYDKAISSVQTHMARQPGWQSWSTGPLNRPVSGDHWSGRVAPTTQQKLNALNAAKAWAPYVPFPGDLEFMARNTAYVLLDGRVLCKYHKQGDFHEVLVGTDTVHIPGRLAGRFPVQPTSPAQRPITFGLEICLDHAGHAVEKDIKYMGKVDVHIITSAQLSTEAAQVATTDAGYVVHASSNKGFSGVWKRGLFDGLRAVKPMPIWKDDFLGHPLQFFELELDLAHLMPTKETGKTSSQSWNPFG